MTESFRQHESDMNTEQCVHSIHIQIVQNVAQNSSINNLQNLIVFCLHMSECTHQILLKLDY